MNKMMLTAALGAFALMSAVPAAAQETRPMNLSLKAGIFFPTSDEARDESETWFTIGGEYRFHDFPITSPDYRSALSLSLDYMSGGDFNMMPLMVNYLGMQREWYYSIGAGFASADLGGDDDTLFAYSLGLGYNFQGGTSPAFFEAKWFGASESEASGLALTVGVRF